MKVSENLILREVAGEHVLIPTGELATKIYGIISLNESGVLLYKKLQKECTKDELIQAVLDEYETDDSTAAHGVENFLKKMNEVGLLST